MVAAHFEPGSTQPPLLAQQAYEANRPRVHDLMAQGDAVLDALADAGIGAVALKGLHALRAGWWPDPMARVMRDLDVLVAEAEAEAAQVVLARPGLSGAAQRPRRLRRPRAGRRSTSRAGPARSSCTPPWSCRGGGGSCRRSDVLAAGSPMSTTDAVVHSIAHAQLHDEAHLLGRLALRSAHELAVLAAGPRAGRDRLGPGPGRGSRRWGRPGRSTPTCTWPAPLFGAAVPEPSRPPPGRRPPGPGPVVAGPSPLGGALRTGRRSPPGPCRPSGCTSGTARGRCGGPGRST